ncbi:MAG TPA: hypothetical protein VF304_09585 [Casimicrobiaceae bacterium]
MNPRAEDGSMQAKAACAVPIEQNTLVEYWLGELDEPTETRIDEHVLGCAICSHGLSEIVALADGIRSSFRHGAMRVFVTDAFVRTAAARGMRVREYRVPRNGSVNCSISAEDEMLVSRLEAPLAGVHRVDAISYRDDGATEVFHDVPFDAASGEVVVAPKLAAIRAMPSHRQRVRLVAVDEAGERVIGDYTFNHAGRETP